jgi:hypothetical protein
LASLKIAQKGLVFNEVTSMSNEQNPFESAIAALEARRAQVNEEIDADIAKLREIGERMAGVALTSGTPLGQPAKIEKDTFYNMTLPDAARKFLSMSGRKTQTTNAIIEALAKGGLKRTTYASMYASLSRRENNVGDIINVNGDWGLPEWYGAKPKPKKKPGESLPSAALEALDNELAEEEAAGDEKTA